MHTYIGGVHLFEAYFVRFKIKTAFLLFCKSYAIGVQCQCF